jgi:flagellar biosynthesis/type III secretory pathway protein FliH
MPTLAEQWLEQGRKEGLTQGLKRGLQQGREEGREAAMILLQRFLNHRFGTPPGRFEASLQTLELEALIQLSETAFEVETLAEFEEALAALSSASTSDSSL